MLIATMETHDFLQAVHLHQCMRQLTEGALYEYTYWSEPTAEHPQSAFKTLVARVQKKDPQHMRVQVHFPRVKSAEHDIETLCAQLMRRAKPEQREEEEEASVWLHWNFTQRVFQRACDTDPARQAELVVPLASNTLATTTAASLAPTPPRAVHPVTFEPYALTQMERDLLQQL